MDNTAKKLLGASLATAVAVSLSACNPNPTYLFAHAPPQLTYVPVANCPGVNNYLYNACRVFSNSCKSHYVPTCEQGGTSCAQGAFIKTNVVCYPVAYVDP